MAATDQEVVGRLLASYPDLLLFTKKMFGCTCVYCNSQPVGWVSDGTFWLKHVPVCSAALAGQLPGYAASRRQLPVPESLFGAPWLREVLTQTAYYTAFHKRRR